MPDNVDPTLQWELIEGSRTYETRCTTLQRVVQITALSNHPRMLLSRHLIPFPPPAPPRTDPQVTPAFYRLRDVIRISALSRSTIYRRIAEGRFPPPVTLGGRASGWPHEDLQRWINDPQGFRVIS